MSLVANQRNFTVSEPSSTDSSKAGLLKAELRSHLELAHFNFVKPVPSNSAGGAHWMERAAALAVGCKSSSPENPSDTNNASFSAAASFASF